MIVNYARTQNFSAASAVNVEGGQGDAVLFMNASINGAGEVTFSEQIRNMELYKQNTKTVNEDLAQFKADVLKYATE